jgi:DNA-binding NarL/FixJ family response regulator
VSVVGIPLLRIGSAALDAVLDAIPSPAFVLGPRGRILRANAAGEAMLQADHTATIARLRADARKTRFPVSGARDHCLAIVDAPPGDIRPRVAAAARRWRLTSREADVLALVGEGRSNAAIAHAARMSEKTVEVRLSALLRKAGAAGRTELIALLWTAA